MDRTFLIHAGMPKTGSTAIQAALIGLQTPTHEYLDLGRANHSHLLHAAFEDAPSRQLRNDGVDAAAFEAGREEARRVLRAALDSVRAPHVMISAEYLSRFDVEALSALRNFLRPHGAGHRVIAYVRPPLSRAESSVQQALKQGRYSRLGGPTRPDLTWNRLKKVFGSDNVEMRPFRRDLLFGGDVVRDFCERWGIERPEAGGERTNESLSLEACALLLAQSRRGRFGIGRPGSTFAYARLTDLLAGFGRGRLRLHPDVLSAYADAIRKSYASVAETLGADLYDLDEAPAGGAIRREEELLDVAASMEDLFREHVAGIEPPEGAVPMSALEAARVEPEAGGGALDRVSARLDAFLFAAREHWEGTGRSARGEIDAGRRAVSRPGGQRKAEGRWRRLKRFISGSTK